MREGRNYNNMSQRGWRQKLREGLKQRLLYFLDSQDHPGYFPSVMRLRQSVSARKIAILDVNVLKM